MVLEVKSFNQPPPTVLTCFQGVFTLMGKSKITWKSIQTELAAAGWTDKLVVFSKEQKDKLPASRMKKLAVLTAKPEFTSEIMAKASSVAAVLTEWVLSMERYHKTKESCKIKMSELETAKEMVEGLQNENEEI